MRLADLLAVLAPDRRAAVQAEFDARTQAQQASVERVRAAFRASRDGLAERRERRTREREAREAERAARRALRASDQRDFVLACLRAGLPQPVPELRFDAARAWRFDFAWPERRVALEVDGGIGWGRHTRAGGWHKDTEKLNAAVAAGWRVLRCTPATRDHPDTFAAIQAALTHSQESR
jgi:very-short-patch-repair endonuclease